MFTLNSCVKGTPFEINSVVFLAHGQVKYGMHSHVSRISKLKPEKKIVLSQKIFVIITLQKIVLSFRILVFSKKSCKIRRIKILVQQSISNIYVLRNSLMNLYNRYDYQISLSFYDKN